MSAEPVYIHFSKSHVPCCLYPTWIHLTWHQRNTAVTINFSGRVHGMSKCTRKSCFRTCRDLRHLITYHGIWYTNSNNYLHAFPNASCLAMRCFSTTMICTRRHIIQGSRRRQMVETSAQTPGIVRRYLVVGMWKLKVSVQAVIGILPYPPLLVVLPSSSSAQLFSAACCFRSCSDPFR